MQSKLAASFQNKKVFIVTDLQCLYSLSKIRRTLCCWIPLIRQIMQFCSVYVYLFSYRHLQRPIHTRDFAPGACSRGTLWEQSSSVCTNDFMGILHPREQNFHPAKCSTIFNRLNVWEQAPGANWANLKTLPRVYWQVQNDPGACSGSKNPLCVSAFKFTDFILQR